MRIADTLKVLQEELMNYDELEDVEVDNLVNETGQISHTGVVITLVKVDEESTLKNGKHHRLTQSYRVVFKNRKIYTNLYVLISSHGNYISALTNLSKVLEFFQGKNVFTHLDGTPSGSKLGENYKLIVELQDFTFEQINYIWSIYGGAHKPSVFYKVRLVPHEARDKQIDEGDPILEVNVDGSTTY